MKGYSAMKFLLYSVIVLGIAVFAMMSLMATQRYRLLFEEANRDYRSGLAAATIYEQSVFLNQALTRYLELEKASSFRGDGAVLYNLGNTYFQLRRYPEAVYYYLSAQKVLSQDADVRLNLELAREQLFLPPLDVEVPCISLAHLLQLFLLVATAAGIAAGCAVWYGSRSWQLSAWALALCTAVLVVLLAMQRLASPAEAVVMQGTLLYTGPNPKLPLVQEAPLLSGTRVEVLGLASDPTWLQIRAPTHVIGYVPQEKVRIIK